MSTFDDFWTELGVEGVTLKALARRAYVAGMEQAAKLAGEKRAYATEQLKALKEHWGDNSPCFNQWMGIHDGAGELAEAIRDEAQSAKGLG